MCDVQYMLICYGDIQYRLHMVSTNVTSFLKTGMDRL
jgi:hypothetical protein